ncbi:MAG: chitobiase/beta-hexosaminidase C-terminal domain-containing protein [Paramuribaculum sp.]|nr:chitobiase/beta-hexosaminidase C-terminal domain-containing protein [Paramuribaculum sp.]
MKDFHHVQYMELPRLAAMAEVQWTQPEQKDYAGFTKRLPALIHLYETLGYNYAKHVFDINGKLVADPEKNAFHTELSTIDDAPIHYTLDGSEPTEDSPVMTEPVIIDKSTVIKAVAIRPDGKSRVWTDSVSFNKATSHTVTLGNEPHSRYKSSGPGLLTDGRFGGSSFNTGEWIGFEGKPLVATIDLGSEQEISSVSMRLLVNTPNWIFDARSISVEVSTDGSTFTEVASEVYPQMTKETIEIASHTLTFAPVTAQYVKVTAVTETSIPAWHGIGKDKPGFLFVDEIVIN